MKNLLSSTRPLIISAITCIALTGCTKPKETTAIGAAAGGAIGAGLGAIIGNQTGNAGSGLAIGAVAGAATGALVGNALQAQKEKVDSQSEAISRQEQTLRAQRTEIEELRNMQSDNSRIQAESSITSPSKTQTVNAYLVEQKRLQLQKRGPAPRGQSSASEYTPPPLAGKNSEPLARYKEEPKTSKSSLATTAHQASPKAAVLPSKGLQERDLASEASSQAAKIANAPATGNSCDEAKQAREAAATASEDSDKLFHLRKALRLCPGNAETHYELGQAYLHMDRAADASYEFKQALSINPGYQAAKDSLKELDQGKAHY